MEKVYFKCATPILSGGTKSLLKKRYGDYQGVTENRGISFNGMGRKTIIDINTMRKYNRCVRCVNKTPNIS